MRLVPVNTLRPGLELGEDIYDQSAIKLLRKGYVLTPTNIESLQNTHIFSIYIKDQYCFDDTIPYTSKARDMAVIIKDLIEITNIISAGNGNSRLLQRVIEIVSQIIEVLGTQYYSSKIEYEACKVPMHGFEGSTLYIAMMSCLLGIKMNLNRTSLIDLFLGILLRDIAVLSPNIHLNPNDFKMHPLRGYLYLKQNYSLPYPVLQIILQHQELYNGSGYPYALKGDKICVGARIQTIIEHFYQITEEYLNLNRLTSEHGMCWIKPVEESINNNIKYLDPQILEVFMG
ncbi:MAG: hypothetical protein BEN19_05480, partial [Epulopiscium sp. Nuni2H_MBin003]